MSNCNPNSPVGDVTHVCGTCSKSVPVFVSPESCDRHCGIDTLFGVKNCPKWTERDPLTAYNADGTKITSFAGYALDDAYDMVIRYERLEQVAWEMFHEYRELMKDYLWDNGASSSATKQRRLIVMFHDRLEECGVSVDE